MVRTYCLFKSSANTERYLHLISNLDYRKAVTRLRISAHNLPVESGRYKKIPHENRYCSICNCDLVGDEYHYLLECKSNEFVKLRESFFNRFN
jgi:hypothetical protein